MSGISACVAEFLKIAEGLRVVYAGGIATISDVKKLLLLKKRFTYLEGCISGKALYEGTLDFKEALSVGRKKLLDKSSVEN